MSIWLRFIALHATIFFIAYLLYLLIGAPSTITEPDATMPDCPPGRVLNSSNMCETY